MRVLGLGDNVMDAYYGPAVFYPGGNAYNVSVNAKRLEADSAYLGWFSDDEYGVFLKKYLADMHVDVSRCRTRKATTAKVCVEQVENGERHYLRNEIQANCVEAIQLSISDAEYINQFDAVITSCNSKLSTQLPLIRNHHGVLVFDFGEKGKYRTREYIAQVDDFVDLMLFSMPGVSRICIEEYVESLGVSKCILVTRGSESSLFFLGEKCIEFSGKKCKPVDTMGAGDAYITAFVIAMLKHGWNRLNMPKEDEISLSMQAASEYASRIVMEPGGFNHPYTGRKAIIFDMDGVLVDSETACAKMYDSFLKDMGKQLDDDSRDRMYGCSSEMEDMILAKCLGCSIDTARELKQEYTKENMYNYADIVFHGTGETLSWLKQKGYLVGLASSSPRRHVEMMLAQCGFSEMFDAVVTADEIKEAKPSPEIYCSVLNALGIHPEEALVIEDSKYGITAANRAGIPVIQRLNQNQPVLSDMIIGTISSITELKSIIV